MRTKTIALSVFLSLFCVNSAFAELNMTWSYIPHININIMDVYDFPDKKLMVYLVEPFLKGYEDYYLVYYRNMRIDLDLGTIFLEGDLGSAERPYAGFTLECKKTPENDYCEKFHSSPVEKITADLIDRAHPHELVDSNMDVTRKLAGITVLLPSLIINNQNKPLPRDEDNHRPNGISLGLRAVYSSGDMNYSFTLIDSEGASSSFVKFRFVTNEGVAEVGPENKDPLRAGGWIFSINSKSKLKRYALNSRQQDYAYYPWEKGLSFPGPFYFTVKLHEATAWRANGTKVNIMPRLAAYYLTRFADTY